ncbi:MAG: hypothetical protein AB1646_13890 [Thermodesulfobacteriota bacterium]
MRGKGCSARFFQGAKGLLSALGPLFLIAMVLFAGAAVVFADMQPRPVKTSPRDSLNKAAGSLPWRQVGDLPWLTTENLMPIIVSVVLLEGLCLAGLMAARRAHVKAQVADEDVARG